MFSCDSGGGGGGGGDLIAEMLRTSKWGGMS